ncbi:MnuA family membrane nuclease [Mycoplasmopsis lipofaciens]|uniref:MnuA family membrane nuclease n=1 Tax=Mycoplasmopsis lipofaciens TaxID=114884 RepID=UPI0004868EE7|nr:hypothetical protein [Mycoplasmopsis lipofaciens]
MKKTIKRIFSLISLVPVAVMCVGGYYVYKYFKSKNSANNNVNIDKLDNKGFYAKNEETLRVMHWNILNFGGSTSTQNSAKVYNIAVSIFKSNADIIGLTEINYGDANKVDRIIKVLNSFDPNISFSYVYQDKNEALNPEYKNSKEQIVIIYKNKIVEPRKFNNNKIGDSFLGPIKSVQQSNSNIVFAKEDSYVRPLFGSKFFIKPFNKTITTFFGHFDSPNSKENSGEIDINGIFQNKYIIKNQGSKEVSEALGLYDAFLYFKNISNNDNIIFGGDTNINSKGSTIFNYLTDINNSITSSERLQTYYNSSLANEEKFLTSLTTETTYNKNKKHSGYANSYDKWLFYEKDLNILDNKENPTYIYKIDIVKGFESGLFDKTITTKKYLQTYKDERSVSDFKLIRKGLSDHAPIIIDVINK